MFVIEEMPSARIAYTRRHGAYGAENTAQVELLKAWASQNALLTGEAPVLGIPRDNPAVTAPENCRYDACIVLPESAIVDSATMAESTLPGGRYAVFTVGHTAHELQAAWGQIFGEIHRSGSEVDEHRPVIERYAPRMLAQHLCEICVPVH